MSISYKGVVGYYAKSTLPSVETWGTNMNILRDPPRSIMTRKIDRVGETSEITQMVQESGDRVGETINVYARGTNPFVAVDYSNNGNNGGQRSGGRRSAGMVSGSTNSGKQSFLPYRVARDGAFRPPMRDLRELLPLSRLPRVWTSSFTQPGFADFSRKAMCPGMDNREVKKESQMLKACVRPTTTYQIETPITETYEVKNNIKNPVQVAVGSGIQSRGKFNAENGESTYQVHADPLHANANVNKSASNRTQKGTIEHFDTDRYTHEALYGEMPSNLSSNKNVTPLHELYGMQTDNNIQDRFNISHTAHLTGYNRYDLNDNVSLERNLPIYEAQTQKGYSIHKRMEQAPERTWEPNRPVTQAYTNIGMMDRGKIDEISSRDYRLKPTITPGDFSVPANRPLLYQENGIVEFDAHKADMRQKVYEMQQARNATMGSFDAPMRIE